MTKRLLWIALVALPISAHGAGFAGAPVVFKNENWSVRKIIDSMTDRASCTATYRDRYDIQVVGDAFYINMRGRGGIRSYQMRLDDETASATRMASPLERRMSAIALRGPDVSKVVAAKRLRISGLSVLGTPIDEDISLDGLTDAFAAITGPDCR